MSPVCVLFLIYLCFVFFSKLLYKIIIIIMISAVYNPYLECISEVNHMTFNVK